VARTRKPSGAGEAPARGGPTLELMARAQEGDEACLKDFQALLDDPERGPAAVEFFGDLAARARDFAVDLVAQTNLAIKAATPRKLAQLRAELEGPDPNPIERLLAERVAYCWLILWEYESALVLRAGQLTAQQSAYHQRRIDGAHRRYCSALRSLAAVRKLALPSVRVTIGPNTVTVTTEGDSAGDARPRLKVGPGSAGVGA
jgi:hypothetical protein